APREVAERRPAKLDPRRRHRVRLQARLCRLERPRRVLDLGPVQPSLVDRVQTVALGEKPFQRVGLWVEDLARRLVPALEPALGVVVPLAGANDPARAPLDRQPSLEVRQLVNASGASTASKLEVSRLKNQIPGLSSTVT